MPKAADRFSPDSLVVAMHRDYEVPDSGYSATVLVPAAKQKPICAGTQYPEYL
jgi:hypothetical protein